MPEGDLSTGLLVFLLGLAAAVLAAATSISRTDLDPIEPRLEERWLARLVSGSPRLAHFVSRRLDRKTAGGLFLTVGFFTVLILAIFVASVYDMVAGEFGLAGFDLGIAEFGATHAGTATAEVQALFTHLGGNTVITVVTAATAGWGWWRYGDPQVALFMEKDEEVAVAIFDRELTSLLESHFQEDVARSIAVAPEIRDRPVLRRIAARLLRPIKSEM